jgi:hypothetical protein
LVILLDLIDEKDTALGIDLDFAADQPIMVEGKTQLW